MVRFFFMHLGGLVGIVVYFVIFDGSLRSEAGLRAALPAALIAHTAYMALARRRGELKQFDVGLWLFYAIGLVGTYGGLTPIEQLYRIYSPAALFAAFALTALLPPLFGGAMFVDYFMERTVPRWQRRLAVTPRIGRVIWMFWIGIFTAAAVLAAYRPYDPLFTAVYPNLLIFALGITGNYLLPKLYLYLYPPELPDALEPWIMGLPTVFDRRAVGGVRAEIQFCVSGAEPGDYYLKIADGKCASFEGRAPAPNVTVFTPESVWLRIFRGELDGGLALTQGLYRVGGDAMLLAQFPAWFPRR